MLNLFSNVYDVVEKGTTWTEKGKKRMEYEREKNEVKWKRKELIKFSLGK